MQKINILKRAIVDSLYIFVMGSIGLLFILEYTARDLIRGCEQDENKKPRDFRLIKGGRRGK